MKLTQESNEWIDGTEQRRRCLYEIGSNTGRDTFRKVCNYNPKTGLCQENFFYTRFFYENKVFFVKNDRLSFHQVLILENSLTLRPILKNDFRLLKNMLKANS